MTERDLLFLAMILITATTLVVFIWQYVRRRRRPAERPWWAGPEDPSGDAHGDDGRRDDDRQDGGR